MPRAVHPSVQALLTAGAWNVATAIDVSLVAALSPLRLSTCQIHHDSEDFVGDYAGRLSQDIGNFEMSLDPQTDEIEFKVENLSLDLGRALTGFDQPLAGARGVLGTFFLDPRDASVNYYDARMQGEVRSGDISDLAVQMTLISDMDIVVIGGTMIASEFPWREPIHVAPLADPDDTPRPIRPIDPDAGDGLSGRARWRGRYGDMEHPYYPLLSD